MKEKESLGEFLRREREMRKLSLRELSKHTKVREHFLKAIEEERYDLLPSSIYVRGFLSAYAKHVGADPHEVLLRYERLLKGGPAVDPEIRPERKVARKRVVQPIRGRRQVWIVSAAIALSLLASYFLHPFFSNPPPGPSPVETAAREETIPIPLTLQSAEIIPVAEAEPFSLEFKAFEETWIRIRIDDESTAEAIFKPGEEKSYRATRQIELLVGNAGGLEVVLNGRKLERFGKSGEVITLVFTSQGVEKK